MMPDRRPLKTSAKPRVLLSVPLIPLPNKTGSWDSQVVLGVIHGEPADR